MNYKKLLKTVREQTNDNTAEIRELLLALYFEDLSEETKKEFTGRILNCLDEIESLASMPELNYKGK